MSRHLFTLVLVALTIGSQAQADTLCTAGNPNTTSVAESTPTSAFTDHGNGTVTHALTGLMWKQCAQGQSGADCATGTATALIWSDALANAVADTTAGHSDWRLPSKKELESIVEYCGYNPSINTTVFPTAVTSVFWSGSSYAPDPTYAWTVSFAISTTASDRKAYHYYVRLVRGGQSYSAFDAINSAPSATSLNISGTAQFGQVLTGSYVYADAESDPQDTTSSGSSYRFVRSTDASVTTTGDNTDVTTGTTGGIDQTYTAQAADVGKYLFYCVTPQASSGTLPGVEACSSATAAVSLAAQAITGFAPTTPVVFGASPATLTASGGASGNSIVYASGSAASICTVSGTQVTFVGVGVCNLTANQAAGGNYSAAPQVTGSVTINAVILTNYSAPSATGTGTIAASFSGGGAACGYSVSQFIPLVGHAASPPSGSAPAGYGFPHGLFDFTASGCVAGATLNFTITYPQVLPAGTVYWKYGPTSSNATPHWYQLPAVIVGNTAAFSITDGGLGDDDLSANGTIVDQGGPGIQGGAVVTGIPTLSEWGLIMLAGLLVLFGLVQLPQGRRR